MQLMRIMIQVLALKKNTQIHNQGFTLFELIIIIVIISVLAVAVGPNVMGLYARAELNAALNDLENALNEGQKESIRQSKQCTLQLDTTNGQVINDPSNTTDTAKENCLLRNRVFASGVNMAHNGGNTINYTFKGSSTTNKTIILHHNNLGQQSNTKCLVISSPLGIIRTGFYDVKTNNMTGSNITANDCNQI